MIREYLNIGSGKTKEIACKRFSMSDWREIRLDLDPGVEPDIVASITDMRQIETGRFAAVYTSHVIEHLYPHEHMQAFMEIRRVLSPEGFVIITCPDLMSICTLVSVDKLFEVVYNSPAGPITPYDMLFGHRPSLMQGNLHMGHCSGFTLPMLLSMLKGVGFKSVAGKRRDYAYDLWVVAQPQKVEDEDMRALAQEYLP